MSPKTFKTNYPKVTSNKIKTRRPPVSDDAVMYQILLQLVSFAFKTDISHACAMCIKQCTHNPSLQSPYDLCDPGIGRCHK